VGLHVDTEQTDAYAFHDKDVVVVFMAEGQLKFDNGGRQNHTTTDFIRLDPLQRPGPHPQRRTREGSSPRRDF
jgi:hypothetical protein